MYCRECGNKIKDNAVVCIHCGIPTITDHFDNDQKEWLVTLLLSFFVGYLGIHRFYTGHTAIGIVQLLTLGGCGIWALIDFIIILVGNYKDSDGRPLKK
tara:strand:+ start:1433 stop:1729 length:297 start_codon:yes stop_codon:yes gene_type:complete